MSVPTINVTQLYISNQKMLYNIMVTNRILIEQFGVSSGYLDTVLFNIDPVKDLGVGSVPDLMNPLKC